MSEREEGRQNALTHESIEAEPPHDTNEQADDKVDVHQPDGSPVPRPEK